MSYHQGFFVFFVSYVPSVQNEGYLHFTQIASVPVSCRYFNLDWRTTLIINVIYDHKLPCHSFLTFPTINSSLYMLILLLYVVTMSYQCRIINMSIKWPWILVRIFNKSNIRLMSLVILYFYVSCEFSASIYF